MRRRLGCRIAARLPQTIESSGSTASRSSNGEATVADAEQPHDGEQHAGLDDRGHVGRHRHARAFVGVGRPGVERHDRGLQEERQQHQHHGRARHRVAGAERAREACRSPSSRSRRTAATHPSGTSRSRCRRAPGTSAPPRRSAAAGRPAAPARTPAATSAPARGTASGSCRPTAAGTRRTATTAAGSRTRRRRIRRATSAAPAAPAPAPCALASSVRRIDRELPGERRRGVAVERQAAPRRTRRRRRRPARRPATTRCQRPAISRPISSTMPSSSRCSGSIASQHVPG